MISTNYSIDAEDGFSKTAEGRGAADCFVSWCSIRCARLRAGETGAAVAGVGLTLAPSPTVYNASLLTVGGYGQLNYTVSNSNSFVVIAVACNSRATCSLSYPSGCTQRQAVTDTLGDEAFIVTCQSQAAANYNVTVAISNAGICEFRPPVALGSCYPISMAAYVYSNYSPSGS